MEYGHHEQTAATHTEGGGTHTLHHTVWWVTGLATRRRVSPSFSCLFASFPLFSLSSFLSFLLSPPPPPPPLSLLSHSVNGVVDLVRLPYHQYQEDGRIMWGLQQGASSFSTSTGVAVVELTSRTLETLQVYTQSYTSSHTHNSSVAA